MSRLNAEEEYEKHKAKQSWGSSYWNDGREAKLLKFVKDRPNYSAIQGNPKALLAAIEEFQTGTGLMTIGTNKGQMISKIIADNKPKVMAEMGAYVGYSAVMFGNAVREAGGKDAKYYSLEINAEFAAITEEMVKIAGLEDTVIVVVGGAGDGAAKLHADGIHKIDILFIDHQEIMYVPDLQQCEELGVIDTGSIVIADNVVFPGAPLYRQYIYYDAKQKKRAYDWAKRYGPADGLYGKPSLIYENTCLESDSGLELSKCVAVGS